MLVLLKALLALFGLELAPRRLRQPRFRPAMPIPRELLRFGAPAAAARTVPPTVAPAALLALRAPAPRIRGAFARVAPRLLMLLAAIARPAVLSHASPPLLSRPRCAVALWLVCDAPPPRRARAA